jgi:hypothetical protein
MRSSSAWCLTPFRQKREGPHGSSPVEDQGRGDPVVTQPGGEGGGFQWPWGAPAWRRSPRARAALRKMTFEMIGASQIGEITSSQCSLRACSRIEVAPRPEDQTGVFAILVYKP